VPPQPYGAEGLARGGAPAGSSGMDAPLAHDAFLVDLEHFGPAERDFLDGL
jgi:hypothetical protein